MYDPAYDTHLIDTWACGIVYYYCLRFHVPWRVVQASDTPTRHTPRHVHPTRRTLTHCQRHTGSLALLLLQQRLHPGTAHIHIIAVLLFPRARMGARKGEGDFLSRQVTPRPCMLLVHTQNAQAGPEETRVY